MSDLFVLLHCCIAGAWFCENYSARVLPSIGPLASYRFLGLLGRGRSSHAVCNCRERDYFTTAQKVGLGFAHLPRQTAWVGACLLRNV
ncbi:hypothetical protein M3J09_012884 [Ascochyta lentis]